MRESGYYRGWLSIEEDCTVWERASSYTGGSRNWFIPPICTIGTGADSGAMTLVGKPLS